MPDDGKPTSLEQLERRGAARKALRDSLFFAMFFGGVILINAILALLLIEFVQAMGWFEVSSGAGVDGAATLSAHGSAVAEPQRP